MAEPVKTGMPRNYYLREEDSRALTKWWETLDENRGMRARLRRVDSPDDVLLTDSFFWFLGQMPQHWSTPAHLYPSAMVAATLAQVVGLNGQSFAAQLGSSEQDRPVMSELRFKQLIKSRTPEEFFRRLLRAVRLLDRTVNIVSLAEGILQWYQEFQSGPDSNPVNRLGVKWARDYYIPRKNKSSNDLTDS